MPLCGIKAMRGIATCRNRRESVRLFAQLRYMAAMKLRHAFFILAAGLVSCAHAEVKLPALFSDHAVLQRDATVPVWGWAAKGEDVTVSIAGQTQSTKASNYGKWRVNFQNLPAGGPHTLTVKGGNTLTVKDVLVGEVWLGSGQSNMAMTVNRARDYEKEQAAAKLPQIRMFTVGGGVTPGPQNDVQGKW